MGWCGVVWGGVGWFGVVWGGVGWCGVSQTGCKGAKADVSTLEFPLLTYRPIIQSFCNSRVGAPWRNARKEGRRLRCDKLCVCVYPPWSRVPYPVLHQKSQQSLKRCHVRFVMLYGVEHASPLFQPTAGTKS